MDRASDLALPILLTCLACARPDPASESSDEAVGETGEDTSDSSTSTSETGSSSETETETGTETETDTEGEGEADTEFDPTPTDLLDALGCDIAIPEPSEERWQAFVEHREAWLYALSEPILACVAEQDTAHPAFHGCIDWHSAVHGTWALHALHRHTGEPAYLQAADAVLDPEGLAGELEDIAGDNLPFVELLYGRAWFLLLARERELASAGAAQELRPHAELIADQLEAYLADLSPAELANFAVADDYFSASWALLNLHRWAVHTGDSARAEWVELVVHDVVMAADCPLIDELGFTADFFPPCLMRAHAVLETLPTEQTADWLASELPGPGEFELAPLCDPAPAHTAGLNFSRAWGLWSLWQASGDPHYRDLYVEHVWRHVAQPDYWAEDYWQHSHWIAQFGVYAIALSL